MTPYSPASPADFQLQDTFYVPPGAADFDLTGSGIQPSYVPGLLVGMRSQWDGAAVVSAAITMPHTDAPERDLMRGFGYGTPVVKERLNALLWDRLRLLDIAKVNPWGLGNPLEASVVSKFDEVPERDLSKEAAWEIATTTDGRVTESAYGTPPKADAGVVLDFGSVNMQIPKGPYEATVGKYSPPELADFDLSAAEVYSPPAGDAANFRLTFAAPLLRIRPTAATWGDRYGQSDRFDHGHRFPWGRGQYYRKQREWGVPYPEYDGPIGFKDPAVQPEIKLSYQIMNTVNVVTLPGLVPVNLRDITLELDIDSWSWSLTGTVKGAASLAQIKPTPSGPVDIQVTLNGHVFVIMVEGYSRSRKLADDVYTVRGSSRTQYLAAPYAPKLNAVNGSSINAKQAVEDLLLGTGFTLDWNTIGDEATPDWSIPAGALAYTGKTPMEVIKWIADAAGAIVLPDLATDTIIIKPRFPTPPWALSGATMDRIITASMVRGESEDWQPGELYNAVYVSGINLGRGTMVTRQGTAGDLPAPDMFSELQVAVECNQARGEAIIAGSGDRSLHDLEMHIPESATAPGLVLPGHEVEYQDIGQTWRGYVVATKISAAGSGAAPLWQTIKVDRYLEH